MSEIAKERLLSVWWDPRNRTWLVTARQSSAHLWATYEGSESELDELLSIARDVVTGG